MASQQPTQTPNSAATTIIAVVLLAAMLLGGYALIQRGSASPSPIEAGGTAVPSSGWPTIGPTFTPLPTATLLATATSIPAPTSTPAPTPIVINKERVGELAVMVITVSATQRLKSDEAKVLGFNLPFTSESITVEYVARVKLGVKNGEIEYRPTGKSVSVKVPSIEILSIEPDWQASRIVDTDTRFFNSKSAELQKDAWAAAQDAIRKRVLSDTELLTQARAFVALSLKDSLRDLGFTTVVVP
jgi:hypothetical protein